MSQDRIPQKAMHCSKTERYWNKFLLTLESVYEYTRSSENNPADSCRDRGLSTFSDVSLLKNTTLHAVRYGSGKEEMVKGKLNLLRYSRMPKLGFWGHSVLM